MAVAIAAAAGGDDPPAHRKLAGYLRAVLSVPTPNLVAAGSIPPLAPFTLTACGGVPLAPLPEDSVQPHARGSAKWRASGGGGGSIVVRHLRALADHRCVEVEGRVLRVMARKGEGGAVVEARAVVLADVYLPVAAWSGWQFPRSRAPAAAAVFKHLSFTNEVFRSFLIDQGGQVHPERFFAVQWPRRGELYRYIAYTKGAFVQSALYEASG